MAEQISLRSGYLWDCPDCGTKNGVESYERPSTIQEDPVGWRLSEVDGDEIAVFTSGPIHDGVVQCVNCGVVFFVEE